MFTFRITKALSFLFIIFVFSWVPNLTRADGHAAVPLIDESVAVNDSSFSSSGRIHSSEFVTQLEEHAINVLKWQLRTSERVLMLVMLLTSAGVLFAGYQLWHSLNASSARRTKIARVDSDVNGDEQSVPALGSSKMSLGDGKLEFESPIVGLLILAVSLAALYLFLMFVYKIEIILV